MKETLEPLEKFYRDYFQEWSKQSPKPCNESSFVEFFKNLLKTIDEDDIEFHGNNCYSGKEISIVPNRRYFGSNIELDVVYDKDQLKVFTSNHNGFWIPEFISLGCDDIAYKHIMKILMPLLIKTFGIF